MSAKPEPPAPSPTSPILSLLDPFCRFTLDDSGIALRRDEASPRHIFLVRLWNFLEPTLIFGFIMLVVWTTRLSDDVRWLKPVFGAVIAWVLVFSPIVHYPFEKRLYLPPERRSFGFYFFECRGLGSPLKYFFGTRHERPHVLKYWKAVLGLLLFQDVLFACACVAFNAEVTAKFHEAHMTFAGMIAHRAAIILAIDVFLVAILFPFILRLDNFDRAVPFIFAFALILVASILLGNFLFHWNEPSLRARFDGNPYMNLVGPAAADRLAALRPIPVGGQWAGYVFWGFLQQLLFLGVFSVQFSRAFDVANSRVQRALYCLSCATCFALIHVPNFWLCIVTFIGGLLAAWYFIQCRNLYAFGIAHGLGGTLSNKLLPIPFSVGPR